jgi:hypothetical protein
MSSCNALCRSSTSPCAKVSVDVLRSGTAFLIKRFAADVGNFLRNRGRCSVKS